MSTSTTNPVAALAQQEAALATAIVALAERIDQIGGITIADALTRLSDSVAGAKARLAGAYSQVQAMASDLTSEIDGLTADLLEDLAANDLVEAPVSLPPLGVLANRVVNATTNGTAHATTPHISVYGNGVSGNVRVVKSTVETVGGDEVIDLAGPATPTASTTPTAPAADIAKAEADEQNATADPVISAYQDRMATVTAMNAPAEDAQQSAPEEKASGRKTRGRGKKS